MERLGVFGGSFDPPHVGHLAVAEWARDRLRLDRVLFVPAGRPPHKRRARLSTAAARLAMIRLAVRGHRAFEVSTMEVRRSASPFTVETLRRFHAERPGRRWFLLIGADSLADFLSWKEPREIVRLATLAVASRTDGKLPTLPPAWLERRLVWLDNPAFDVSSTLVRARVGAGRSIRFLVPDAVVRYIARHRLYRRG